MIFMNNLHHIQLQLKTVHLFCKQRKEKKEKTAIYF